MATYLDVYGAWFRYAKPHAHALDVTHDAEVTAPLHEDRRAGAKSFLAVLTNNHLNAQAFCASLPSDHLKCHSNGPPKIYQGFCFVLPRLCVCKDSAHFECCSGSKLKRQFMSKVGFVEFRMFWVVVE
eukprot:6281097-Amphidinium_carterae.1